MSKNLCCASYFQLPAQYLEMKIQKVFSYIRDICMVMWRQIMFGRHQKNSVKILMSTPLFQIGIKYLLHWYISFFELSTILGAMLLSSTAALIWRRCLFVLPVLGEGAFWVNMVVSMIKLFYLDKRKCPFMTLKTAWEFKAVCGICASTFQFSKL